MLLMKESKKLTDRDFGHNVFTSECEIWMDVDSGQDCDPPQQEPSAARQSFLGVVPT